MVEPDDSTLGASPTSPGLTIVSPPRITDDTFISVLQQAKSPAAPLGPSLYAVCVGRKVCPAVALAFFGHESSFGKAGKARFTLNWGNLRRGPRAYKIDYVNGDTKGGLFAFYYSWVEGLQDFCDLLRGPLYEGAGLLTVEAVVPKYAPSSDNNKPAAYIAAVTRDVTTWAAVDPWASWGSRFPLPPAAREYAIPKRWLVAQPPLGAAIGPEQTLATGHAAQAFEGGVIVWLGGEQTVIVRRGGAQGRA